MLCKERNPSSSAASNLPIALTNTMNKPHVESVVPIGTVPVVAAVYSMGSAGVAREPAVTSSSIEKLSNKPANAMRFQQQSVSHGTMKSNLLALENVPLGAFANLDSRLECSAEHITSTGKFGVPENFDSDEIKPVDPFWEELFRPSDMNEMWADSSSSEPHTW